jgi:hypothetical protein
MTISRTAFFEGDLTQEQREDFYQYMKENVVPIIATFPNSLGVEVSIPAFIESPDHQEVLLMMRHDYESEEAMKQALDSDQRIASMMATKVILERYPIRVHHMNFVRD